MAHLFSMLDEDVVEVDNTTSDSGEETEAGEVIDIPIPKRAAAIKLPPTKPVTSKRTFNAPEKPQGQGKRIIPADKPGFGTTSSGSSSVDGGGLKKKAVTEKAKPKPSSTLPLAMSDHSGRFAGDDDPFIEEKKKFKDGELAFEFNGGPAIKFGYDKFIAVYLSGDEGGGGGEKCLKATIGDFTKNADMKSVETEKVVHLNEEQLLRLVAITFNNLTGSYNNPKSFGNDSVDLCFMLHLGDGFYFVLRSYNSTALANIRKFYRNDNGDVKFTKTGVQFGVRNWESFAKNIMNLTIPNAAKNVLYQAGKVSTMSTKEPDLSELLKRLPLVMYQNWLKRLQEKCEKCQELRELFEEPDCRDNDRTCHWGKERLPLPRDIKKQTNAELVVSNKILGMVMMLRPYGTDTDFINVLDFNVQGFMDRHAKAMWEDAKSIAMKNLKIQGVDEID